jgi:hypothetical protein
MTLHKTTSSLAVINELKAIFARHGIQFRMSYALITDNNTVVMSLPNSQKIEDSIIPLAALDFLNQTVKQSELSGQ